MSKPSVSAAALAAAKELLDTYDIEHYAAHTGGSPVAGYAGSWQRPSAAEVAAIITRHMTAAESASLYDHTQHYEIIGHYTKVVIGVCCGGQGLLDVACEEPNATFNRITKEAFESYGDNPWVAPGQHSP